MLTKSDSSFHKYDKSDTGLGLFQENDYICELRTKVRKI
jgi:hypothetical protein